jgi:hypothetical protein
MVSATEYLTVGGIPFVVTPILGTMRCRIPVVPGGDGAETEPLEVRTARCPHRAEVLIGSGPVCGHHYAGFFRVAGTSPEWSPSPC